MTWREIMLDVSHAAAAGDGIVTEPQWEVASEDRINAWGFYIRDRGDVGETHCWANLGGGSYLVVTSSARVFLETDNGHDYRWQRLHRREEIAVARWFRRTHPEKWEAIQ